MAFFDKLGDIARNIGDKTSEAMETAKLNGKISAEKTAIAECMRQIGEIYYQKHRDGDSGDPAAAELLAAIDGHNGAIADAKAEIERVKAKNAAPPPAPPAGGAVGTVCTSCGRANAADTKFCQECGAKLEAPPPPAPPADGATCPSCGKTNPASTKFCQECGAKIEAPPPATAPSAIGAVCPSCGASNPTGTKFCQECGAKLGG